MTRADLLKAGAGWDVVNESIHFILDSGKGMEPTGEYLSDPTNRNPIMTPDFVLGLATGLGFAFAVAAACFAVTQYRWLRRELSKLDR